MTQPALLLLAGNMCDARLWDSFGDLAAAFADLSQDGSIEQMADAP